MFSPPAQTLCIVTKRDRSIDGRLQRFSREKLRHSVDTLMWGLNTSAVVVDDLIDRIEHGLTTTISAAELQLHCATTAASSATKHPDFSRLAGRLYVAALHKSTEKSFVCWVMGYGSDSGTVLDPDFIRLTQQYGTELEDAIVHSRDFGFTYTSIRSLAHSYLVQADGRVIERPQHMYMRVALAIHKDSIPLVLRTYDALSRQLFTFATPVLANAGTLRSHFASCFLYTPDLSGPKGMLKSSHDLDLMWLADGGIGLSLAEVPCRRPRPHFQPGIIPLMRLYDAHAEYTSLWRPTRSSAATVYLPIWHGDVRTFAVCRTSRAARHEQIKNLYAALWVPDVFMERSETDEEWTLFDPRDVPALQWYHGEAFTAQYIEYERTVAPVATVRARELWKVICRSQQESGVPFILYQDAINAKNNEAHLGTVHTSNLCTEIVQFSSREQTAVCTLASVAVPRFASPSREFDFEGLHETTKLAVQGLNALIDMDDYPTPEARESAKKTRALGIGVQGLADVFMISHIPFGSSLARDLNTAIFEAVYHGAYEASNELAQLDGPYDLFAGSPAASGKLQHDMWPEDAESGRYDFARLRDSIRTHGLRNSMLTAQMPTASTSRLLGNFDGTEPYTSNIIVRRVISGDYTEVCPWLVRDLEARDLWTEETRSLILKDHGSVQGIASIPDDLKELYRTAWEIDPLRVVDLAADRGPFIDQTQSMSLHMGQPSPDDLMRLQLHAWRRGLKTGIYYLRTKPPARMLGYGVTGMNVGKRPAEGAARTTSSRGPADGDAQPCGGGCSA